jgi:hypothetical protein
MDSNITLDLANAWGEMELEDITDYQALRKSQMYTALAA